MPMQTIKFPPKSGLNRKQNVKKKLHKKLTIFEFFKKVFKIKKTKEFYKSKKYPKKILKKSKKI
jgi:hypothetical protein